MNVIDFWNLSVEYFKSDIDHFLKMPQPFDRFDDMIKTERGRNIFNVELPCDPKKSEKFIKDDIGRWIYVTRIMGYFLRQYLKQRELEGNLRDSDLFKKLNHADPSFSRVPLEIGNTFKIVSVKRTISTAFKNNWKIKYDHVYRLFYIEVNMDNLSDIPMECMNQVAEEAITILKSFIVYFKEMSPRSVYDEMAMTYAADLISLEGAPIIH